VSRARLRLCLIRLCVAVGLGGAAVPVVTVVGCGGGGDKQPKRPRGGEQAVKQLQQARAAARKGNIDRADGLYTDAFKVDRRFSVLQEHVRFLIDEHRPARAVEVAKAYNDEETADIKGSALYAEALIEAGHAREALDVTDTLLQLDDQLARHHALRGRAQILAGQRDDGIEELRRALQLDTRDPLVRMALGEALLNAKKVDEAALLLRSALKLDADNAEVHVLLGAALREQDEIDEAKAILHKAIKLGPDSGRPYFELGILHNQLAEQADAEQSLSRAVELDPDNTTYWYAYGEILRLRAIQDPKAIDAGKLDQAISAYKRSLDLDPPHPKAASKLAWSLIEAKHFDEAEVLLTGMLRADPDNAENYYFLGSVYAHVRKYKLAIDSWERYMILAPRDDPERERVKKELLGLKRKL
jgi:tetratricopeptide (TPR) repeat protein